MYFCSVVLINTDNLVLDLKVHLLSKVDKIEFFNDYHVYNNTELTMHILSYDNGEVQEFTQKRWNIER